MRDAYVKGPAYSELRPCKPETDPSSFPVYPDLAPCSAYAYAGFEQHSDPGTVATIMGRRGLEENEVRVFEHRVDAMYFASATRLILDKDRRVAILCYRGTQPEVIISILTDA